MGIIIYIYIYIYILAPDQESLLMKGLKFVLPPKNLRYENYMVQFEHFFQDISNIGMSNENLMFSKSHLKNIAFTSYKFYNNNDDKFDNITKEEHLAFLELIKLDNIIIQKAAKGNHGILIEYGPICHIVKLRNSMTRPFSLVRGRIHTHMATVNVNLTLIFKPTHPPPLTSAHGRNIVPFLSIPEYNLQYFNNAFLL